MKTIVAGSRTIIDIKHVTVAVGLAEEVANITITEVVSGTAQGVDQLGELLATARGVPIKRFPAQWGRYGRGAGYRRNAQMAHYADALIAIWDGQSRGTKHMIDLAFDADLKVYIHRTDTNTGSQS